MQNIKLVENDRLAHKSTLDEVLRQGASDLLCLALQMEVSQYVKTHSHLVDETGHRMVVRNGKAESRTVATGTGQIEVKSPRVNDRRDGEKFTSAILPPYIRRTPNVENVIPVLYLRGLSTSDFQMALEALLGKGAQGLSPATIVALKRSWERDLEQWRKTPISDRFVYIFADGVNVKVRLGEDKKICLLTIVGVTETGEKKLLAMESGYRESEDSWKALLRSLVDRGLKAPLLAAADGALGFWKAIEGMEEFKDTKSQRCWVHKIANVLDCFPKRIQPQVKSLLHDMMYAETRKDANETKARFDKLFKDKYPKASEKLDKDWERLNAFLSFPAKHWVHIRTTNIIESTFATVKLRTKVTKGAGSAKTAEAMAFKLFLEAEKKWRKINAPEELQNLLNGVEYKDGVMLNALQNQEGVA